MNRVKLVDRISRQFSCLNNLYSSKPLSPNFAGGSSDVALRGWGTALLELRYSYFVIPIS